jgi:hypothetical protein
MTRSFSFRPLTERLQKYHKKKKTGIAIEARHSES